MFNSGLPKLVSYSAFDTENNVFVSDDQAQHTIKLILDGVESVPTNALKSLGNGVYEIALTEAERTGSDLVLRGESSTANIIIVPVQFTSDVRWDELLQDDGGGNLQLTVTALELAPIADVSGLALETSVQTIISTGGAGPWTTANTAGLALESSVQTIISTGGPGPWTTYGGGVSSQDWTDLERSHIRNRLGIDGDAAVPAATPTLSLQETSDLILATGSDGPWTTFGGAGLLDVNVVAWQDILIDGVNMIEDHSGIPKWTVPALENSPAGDGSVSYVSLPTTSRSGVLELLRGDTLDYNETLNVSLSFTTEIWYTIKRSVDDLDSEALLKISMTGGLEVINGEAAATPADASIAIDAERSGVIRIQCIADRMAELPIITRGAFVDVQLKSVGNIWTAYKRKVSILGDVSRVT